MNLRSVVMGLGLLGVFGTGCVVEVVRGPYEQCASGEACSNGTTCVTASYTSNGNPATWCSVNCASGSQCPVSAYGSTYLPTCVVSVSAGTGLCYDTCVSNVDCAVGTTCASIPGTVARVCVPISTTSTTCGTPGQTCCAGNLCGAGLACNAGVCGTPVVACGTTGQACCAGGTCASGLACNAGVCGTPVVACGAAGQACCSSNTCNAGLACGAGVCSAAVTANRRPYDKCVATTDVCGGGTQCIPSIGQSAGKSRGSACTITCPSGLASACPGYVAGAAQQAVECVNLTGNVAEAQCFRLCQTQNDCVDYNTTCTMFTVGASTIRVCVPVGPRI